MAHRKTHCPKGHEYNEINARTDPKTGGRLCRVCDRERQRKRYAAGMAAVDRVSQLEAELEALRQQQANA